MEYYSYEVIEKKYKKVMKKKEQIHDIIIDCIDRINLTKEKNIITQNPKRDIFINIDNCV